MEAATFAAPCAWSAHSSSPELFLGNLVYTRVSVCQADFSWQLENLSYDNGFPILDRTHVLECRYEPCFFP
jgi:hypothetical protein